MNFLIIIFSQLHTISMHDIFHRYQLLEDKVSIDSQFNRVPDFSLRLVKEFKFQSLGTMLYEKSDTLNALSVDFGITYKNGNLRLFVEPVAKFGDDGLYPTRKYRGVLRSDFKRAYLSLIGKNWKVIAGRLPLHIGESPRFRLLFDKNGPPLEILGFFAKKSKFMVYVIYSQLDRMKAKLTSFYADSSKPVWGYRYLSMHGFDFYPTDWMRLGYKEAVVWGGPDIQNEWVYLNPLTLYIADQFNHAWSDVNIFLLFNFQLVKRTLGSVYGELLIDDYQYAPTVINKPNNPGLVLGLESSKLFGKKPVYILLEYTAITRWVYNHKTPFTRWMYMGCALGHPLGPDLEIYYATISSLGKTFPVGIEFQNIKKGDGSVFSPWPVPQGRAKGYVFPNDNFLSGNVKVSNYIGLLIGYRSNFTFLSARLGTILPVKPPGQVHPYLSFDLTWGLPIRL